MESQSFPSESPSLRAPCSRPVRAIASTSFHPAHIHSKTDNVEGIDTRVGWNDFGLPNFFGTMGFGHEPCLECPVE